jgi:superfamily I DNA/RNA helicase
MQDPANHAIGMVHDGYLKLFVLQRPQLPFDTILFDESQDANSVTIQLVERQKDARKIWVGDPWQAIYGFRGAVNAMEQVSAEETFRLTGSFRFGPAIADTATRLLRWRDPSPPALRGLAHTSGRVQVGRPGQRPYTVLARTNARLFAEAVSVLRETPGARLGFVGGIDGYRFDLIDDTYHLSAGLPVRDAFLRMMGSFEALKHYAKAVGDAEWLVRCKLVNDWGTTIPHWIARIRAADAPVESAAVAFSTAHKAKGLEWSVVQLADDFPDIEADCALWNTWNAMEPGTKRDQLAADLLPQEELNLLYVAVTRAQSALYLPAHLGILTS